MEIKVCIVTIDDKFSQNKNYHTTLDTQMMCDFLIKESNFDVKINDLYELINFPTDEYHYYWIGGHCNPELHQMLKDWAVALSTNNNCRLVPNINGIFSYENKGMQGLIAKQKKIPYVNQIYSCRPNIIIETPKVFKLVNGAGSTEVYLIKNSSQLKNIWRRKKIWKSSVKTIKNDIKYYLGAFTARNKENQDRFKTKQSLCRYVLQDYIEGLSYDYKVLVFGNKVYVLRRNVRDNDFRASGSGKFKFVIDVDVCLLDLALSTRVKLNLPYISIDVIMTDSGYKIIEYQALHFGPYTQLNAPFYFLKREHEWVKIDKQISLENEYCEAFINYIKNRDMIFEVSK